MKQYGVDLLKEYNKTLELQATLTGKIKRRYDFLIKNTPKELLNRSDRHFITTGNEDANELLNRIITIEKLYTDQSKQLNMFE